MTFEQMLTGGQPNSLGRTLEVVELVLADPTRLEVLFNCYFSQDEVVRLCTSSALKRICVEHPEWLKPYIDRLLTQIVPLNQASAQWTLAILFEKLAHLMTTEQLQKAKAHLQYNLTHHTDWIVLHTTMDTLYQWSTKYEVLKDWLKPHLERLALESRKSVAGRAKKLLKNHRDEIYYALTYFFLKNNCKGTPSKSKWSRILFSR